MGFIGDILGTNANSSYTPINGANQQQADTAYTQTQNGLAQQQAFTQALAGQNGIQNQSDVYGQLQGVANGTGPNPAQAQLAQATQANTANQAALMAGQRGSSANGGLLGRQAAMQGGANQQNMVGQAATLQANQSLGALGQLGNMAGQQVAQQQNANNAYNQSAAQQQSNVLNAISGQNSTNAQLSAATAANNAGIIGGALGGVGAAMGTAKAHGGLIEPQQFASGGAVNQNMVSSHGGYQPIGGPSSALGKGIAGFGGGIGKAMKSGPGMGTMVGGSAGESNMNAAAMVAGGGQIGGSAKVAGDSYSNDTVPAILSPGEIVIPRSVTQSSDPVAGAAKFVAAIMAKKHGVKKK